MNEHEPLFAPFELKSLKTRNRIVMSPMGRSSAPGGVPVEDAIGYYGRRAVGGAGLVISEASAIDRPAASNDPNAPHFHGAALERWQEVLDAGHSAGAAMSPQLWHVGALFDQRYPDIDLPFESPSGLAGADIPNGGSMSAADIAATVAAYGSAAGSARAMGYDMIEVHGAHGYLIDQFFWPVTNRRTDGYGGTIGERTRFATEVVSAVRDAVGPGFTVSLRISQWKMIDYTARIADSPQELELWLAPLVDAGVDLFHCSQRRFWEPEFDGSDLNFAGWVKKITGVPTVTVGSVGLSADLLASVQGGEAVDPVGLDRLLEKLDRGEFDLVAVGRGMIANPEWANHVRAGDMEKLRGFSAGMLAALD